MSRKFLISIIPNQPGGKRHPSFFVFIIIFLIVLFSLSLVLFVKLFDPGSNVLIRRTDVRTIENENKVLKKTEEELKTNIEETKKKLEELDKISERIEPLLEIQQLPEEMKFSFEGFNLGEKLDSLVKISTLNREVFTEAVNKLTDKKRKASAIPSIKPVHGSLVRGYGYVSDAFTDEIRFHPGLTFFAMRGTPVHATADGSIIRQGMEDGIGLFVEINHGYGYLTKYGHFQSVRVEEGDFVKRGDVIGYVGKTGRVIGPCLYYEVIKNGKRTNPIFFIFEDIEMMEPSFRKES